MYNYSFYTLWDIPVSSWMMEPCRCMRSKSPLRCTTPLSIPCWKYQCLGELQNLVNVRGVSLPLDVQYLFLSLLDIPVSGWTMEPYRCTRSKSPFGGMTSLSMPCWKYQCQSELWNLVNVWAVRLLLDVQHLFSCFGSSTLICFVTFYQVHRSLGSEFGSQWDIYASGGGT